MKDLYLMILDGICGNIRNSNYWALTAGAQLSGHHSAKQKVDGSVPGQRTSLGCRIGPRVGVHRPMFLSLSYCLPSPLKISK